MTEPTKADMEKARKCYAALGVFDTKSSDEDIRIIAAALAAEREAEKERIASLFEGSDCSPTGKYEPDIAEAIRAGDK